MPVGLPRFLFIVEKPSPQRAPVFDELAARSADFLVLYLSGDTKENGWGDRVLAHPHAFVDDSLAQGLRLAWSILRSPRFRVLACFGYRGPVRLMGILSARLRRRRLVTRSDSNIAAVRRDPIWRQHSRRLVMRVIFPRSTRIWTIGQANEEYWAQYLGRRNVSRIPYEVPVLPASMKEEAEVRSSDPRALRFLFVGRLVALKQIDLLVTAFSSITEPRSAGWRLDIVGDGPERGALQDAARHDPRIVFHGACRYEDLDRFYLAADVLVLPSSYEAWGLVVNEALAFGLWVIVSDQVGAKELITSSDDGSIFRTGDAEALAASLLESPHHLARRPRGPGQNAAGAMFTDLQAISKEV